jgi:hypothetical protein
MDDLSAKLEKLFTEAEDCDVIGGLAADLRKRALFKKLAADLRGMAHDIEAVIAMRKSGSAAMMPQTEKPPLGGGSATALLNTRDRAECHRR